VLVFLTFLQLLSDLIFCSNSEEIAARLIPGYVAPLPPPPDDPPHQAPESSPPTLEPPQLNPSPGKGPEQELHLDHSMAIEPTQPPAGDTPLPPTTSNNNNDTDEDILMPPSSPPRASPTPSPEPSPARFQAEDMSVDQPENDIPKPSTDIFVPVSSPPPTAISRASSVGGRTPRSRLKRRPSFSQMSSSVSPDEFTAPRFQPLPESPSTSTMIAEREKELKAKQAEREKEMERETYDRSRSRGSPVGTTSASKPELQAAGATRGAGPRRARGIKRGLGRGRGQSGFQIFTPGRVQPLSAAATTQHESPGLRIGSRAVQNEPRRLVTPDRTLRATETSHAQPLKPQPGFDTQTTAEQMISDYTHADSEDEDILDDLKGKLDNPDWRLQSQAPYVSQTQSTYPTQTQT
jgi:hypothetical protein